MKTLLCNGTIVTMDSERKVLRGDLLIEDEHIVAIGKKLPRQNVDILIDASNSFVIPGLIQVHTHLCQTLFRGLADDLPLLEWLQYKIWPMEHAHNERSLYASSIIGLLEMQILGTTSILDMGTVQHTDVIFQAAQESGMRYWGGKCLMDLKEYSGPLYEETSISLRDTERLIRAWHLKDELLEYAVCPRFAVSCSDEIMQASSLLQHEYNLLLHTHASESKAEIALIHKRTGMGNIDYLDSLDLLNERTVIVHGVHMNSRELSQMIDSGTPLVHCPSSNLKLASGIAPTELYHKRGLKMGLGADGAPCNNTMDPFMEMRLTALIQKPLYGPEALPAEVAFEMATLGGARVLGRENDIGSLEAGKMADLVMVDRTHPSVATVDNPYSALVYSCSGRDVSDVWIHGRRIVHNGVHQIFDQEEVVADAKQQLKLLLQRL